MPKKKRRILSMGYFSDIFASRVRKAQYSDVQVVVGLQAKDRFVEDWFYAACKRYFMDKFNEIFFDLDRKQEVFQVAFIKLWTQIDDKRIRVQEDKLYRQKASGLYEPMTCTLFTFLMAIAKNEYREIVRENKEEYYDEFFEDEEHAEVLVTSWDSEEDIDEQKNRIVAECINGMPPRCIEILTLFYYEGKSLDEIMEIRKDKSSSKDGLKTAKNKCMTTLKERILSQFEKYHLKA